MSKLAKKRRKLKPIACPSCGRLAYRHTGRDGIERVTCQTVTCPVSGQPTITWSLP